MMIEPDKLLADYAFGVYSETAFVNQVSALIYKHLTIVPYQWTAYKSALETSAAKAGISEGKMAEKWLRALQQNRLTVFLGLGGVLTIEER